MVDPTLPLPGLSPIAEKAIVARFDGGRLSSDGGLLVLRQIERRLSVADRLAACIDDPRDPASTVHTLADIIRFRLLMIAAGYEDANDATGLRLDPLFKGARTPAVGARLVFAVDHLAAGEPARRTDTAAPGPGPGRPLLHLVPPGAAAHRPRSRRHLRRGPRRPATRLFNAHYDDYGFQPIVVFDQDGHFVTAVLRPAKRPKASRSGLFSAAWSARSAPPGRRWRSCGSPSSTRSGCASIKIAARVVEMNTKIKIHLPTSAPDQSIFRLVLGRLPRLVT